MPSLALRDGGTVAVRRISGQQLAADFHFGASRDRPVLIEVVAIDGLPVGPSRLVVMDSHSVWLSHQAEIAPKSNGKLPAVTGLSAAEVPTSRALFLSLVGEATTPPTVSPPPSRRMDWRERSLTWVGKHLGPVVTAVVVAVLTAVVLTWLGLKQ